MPYCDEWDKEVQCGKSDQCVNSALLCNGYTDCENGADENKAFCKGV